LVDIIVYTYSNCPLVIFEALLRPIDTTTPNLLISEVSVAPLHNN